MSSIATLGNLRMQASYRTSNPLGARDGLYHTTNLHVELQGTGDNSGTWGTVLNTTALTIIDQCLGDVQTVSLSSSNVTLTTAQSQHNYFRLTGSLSANVTITWPAIGRSNYVYNATTGSYSVTLA